MASGGVRPGAGRKPKKEKYALPVSRAEKQIVDKLPQLVKNLLKLADGGYERVQEEWVPAGTVVIGSGAFIQKVYPDKEPDELVLVKTQKSIAEPDRAANQYLIDRIAGKPTQKIKDEDAEDKISLYGQLIQELRQERGLIEDNEQADLINRNGAL